MRVSNSPPYGSGQCLPTAVGIELVEWPRVFSRSSYGCLIAKSVEVCLEHVIELVISHLRSRKALHLSLDVTRAIS